MEWLQDAVVEVLNELYDPKEVAKGNLLLQWQKNQKKNKKNKNKNKKKDTSDDDDDDDSGSSSSTIVSDAKQTQLLEQAAAQAQPFSRHQAMVTPATRSEFGDFQVNAAMGLAQALQLNPRECAQQMVEQLRPKIAQIMEEPEIAGPGFVNLRFKPSYLTNAVAAMANDASGRLALPAVAQKQKIVVDYSSPNIAKEMHVGHLRSTIIGDTLCRVLEFVGHDVVRLNHVGDWGTQFGMLVEHLRDEFPEALQPSQKPVDLGDLVVLYKAAKKRFDEDDDFKIRAREGVVKLQAGQPEELAAWETLCAASRVEFEKIYRMLNIQGLQERGESFYNPYLKDVVDELKAKGMAVESDGATVVYMEGYTNRDGSPLPMIVQKSDGGFNYATTDLAAIRQRTLLSASEEGGEQADRVLYVTDAGQSQHFQMVFQAAKQAGFVPTNARLEHVPFGLVQGEDGKKFATRSGETVKLKDLLNEAVKIAGHDLRSRNAATTNASYLEQIDRIAQIVGIGAVKYADLSMNRESNYRFSYDRMLSLNGNTAPYMLYSYARICGIVRKGSGQTDDDDDDAAALSSLEWPAAANIVVSHETELELMRNLVKLPDVVAEVERDLYPHKICDYLFETSQKFNQFYEHCSVNQAETLELKASRLTLCVATAGTLRLLLNLLGIEVVERL
ncbi:arginyl-tRNA synthetase [Fistulifera solaris]|uniref:arginine--tRNA ligase n=1 Tax=Fistulifera solaris TaxID=1519565 RepID=A0A1Z5K1E1_FISSO|nr:arginyl-tRNA synthetase [Fistulifera solaris]|eukprot:GAX20090.1 arginyl-tRNA synthetase [Fistulifera solaris]